MKTRTQMSKGANVSVLDRPLRVLHLEDNPHDRRVIQLWIKEQNIAAEFTDADNEPEFVKALEQDTFDIILSDKSLPGFDGLSALRFVREKFPHIPFVFVTGSMGEEAAIDTIKDGATDYVLKDRLSRLIPAVQRAIRESEQEEKNRQTEEKVRQQAALLDKAQDAILVTDMEDHVQFWNKSAERIYGWPADEIVGRKVTELLRKNAAMYQEAKESLLENGSWTGELGTASRLGNELAIESRWTLVRDELGNPKSILIIDTDITEKKRLEATFLRSQRMDSIGALAGGIAHDLNNALAPVIMGAEILATCEDQSDRERFLGIISSSAQRATELVKQILRFARGSGDRGGPVKLRRLIEEMGKMIQDTFPKSISFSVNRPGRDLWTVLGDTTELHQVLLNLCVNARDAMPHGGQLTLSAQNFMLDAQNAAVASKSPGPYVVISVADTGTGIPPEVLPRIFEPFFTTKLGDKGTGLGLSTVAAIVKNHAGFIEVHTEPITGTEFKVYLPATERAETARAEAKDAVLPAGRGELILVIDDEEAVRELTKTTLESYGYRVVTAQNGLQGIARFKENSNQFKLVVTDTDMPRMDGLGAARAIQELRPDIPVILTSGTKPETAELRRLDSIHIKNLGKPYSLDQLLIAVAEGLHG
jgi:two-component system, cell cycle sensor histidine kinase and response regulator CckA